MPLTFPGVASAEIVTAVLAVAAAVVAAGALAWLLDRRVAAGVGGPAPPGWARPGRRTLAFGLLAALLAAALFLPLAAMAGQGGVPPIDVDLLARQPWRVFLLHGLLLATLAGWGLAGWGFLPRPGPSPAAPQTPPPPLPAADPPVPAAAPGPSRAAGFAAFLRLPAADPAAEARLGLGAGLVAWAAVLAAAVAVAKLVGALGGDALLPEGPPELVAFLGARSVAYRLAVALSAGLVEELFFRGFLQPRLGLGLSSALFVLAHAGYGQPLQLVSVALLSLAYGGLARRRGNVWAAAVAHALFDAVQLLVVIPAALETWQR